MKKKAGGRSRKGLSQTTDILVWIFVGLCIHASSVNISYTSCDYRCTDFKISIETSDSKYKGSIHELLQKKAK